jgi:SnoaL-like domain
VASASADKKAVAETVYRYATGVDRRDWALYRSLFADTVSVDFSGFDPHLEPRVVSADDWVAGIVPLFTGLAATQHTMTNPRAVVDGDEAAITMDVQAHHVHDLDDPASWYTVGGHYENTLVRIDGRWLLTGVRLTVNWSAGDPAVMELARRTGKRLLSSGGQGAGTAGLDDPEPPGH